MTRKSLIPAAILVAGALAAAAAAAPAAPGPPTGDPEGIALVQKVNRYYSSPARLGVHARMAFPGGVIHVRLILARGQVHTILTTVAAGPERARHVATPKAGFEWNAEKRCWRRSAAERQIPQPMIVLRGSRFSAPEPIGSLVRLEVGEWDPDTGRRARTAYKIDPRTGRITTSVFGDAVLTMRTLPKPPTVPSLKPLC